jgi:DNA-binding NarL/FixJ family response regulator
MKLFASLASRVKIFLLADRPDDEDGLTFLKMGIVGYANTYSSPGRINEAVRLIFGGSVWVGQQMMQRLIHETRLQSTENSSYDNKLLEELTNREREIAELVALGKTNLEIGTELEITERTVKSHLGSVFSKLNVTSRLNLALLLNRGRG